MMNTPPVICQLIIPSVRSTCASMSTEGSVFSVLCPHFEVLNIHANESGPPNKKMRSLTRLLEFDRSAIGARARYKTNTNGITEATIRNVLLLTHRLRANDGFSGAAPR